MPESKPYSLIDFKCICGNKDWKKFDIEHPHRGGKDYLYIRCQECGLDEEMDKPIVAGTP